MFSFLGQCQKEHNILCGSRKREQMAEYKTFSTTIKLCVCFLPELQKYLSGSLCPCSAPFPLCPISCLPPSLPSYGHGLTSPSQDPRPTSPSDFEVHWLHSYDDKLLVSCYLPPPPGPPPRKNTECKNRSLEEQNAEKQLSLNQADKS